MAGRKAALTTRQKANWKKLGRWIKAAHNLLREFDKFKKKTDLRRLQKDYRRRGNGGGGGVTQPPNPPGVPP